MVTNHEVLMKARDALENYQEKLEETSNERYQEVLNECIELTQIIINQSEDEIRKGNP